MSDKRINSLSKTTVMKNLCALQYACYNQTYADKIFNARECGR